MFTGIFSTMLIPETNQRTLEELSNEDQHGFIAGPAKPSNRTEEERAAHETIA
jgi:PHS family inorganic phosphate transporter-like MFS transporter